MKTRERILRKALQLFNTSGVKEVTLRKIATALEISQGNLNYHFKTKADIITTLYFRLVDEMNREMEKTIWEQPILSYLYESSFLSMKILFDYRFILKDLPGVLAVSKELHTHYMELQNVRKQQYLYLFANMVTEGLLRPEEFKHEYDRLYERMNILGDNWINTAGILRPDQPDKVVHYHGLLFEVLYPYLTEKGKKAFRETPSN